MRDVCELTGSGRGRNLDGELTAGLFGEEELAASVGMNILSTI